MSPAAPIPTSGHRRASESDPVLIVAWLRRCINLLSRHPDADVCELAEALEEFLSGRATFNQTIFLVGRWRHTILLAERDQALCLFAKRYFPGMTGDQTAFAVDLEHRKYLRVFNRKCRPTGSRGEMHDMMTTYEIPGYEQLRNVFKDLKG